ncbi:MAG: hypothetical protein O7B23_08575 [Deltaproteobacteria bacterium]|nr:hypothetical protein [Deltaproteobacteria bacterium]
MWLVALAGFAFLACAGCQSANSGEPLGGFIFAGADYYHEDLEETGDLDGGVLGRVGGGVVLKEGKEATSSIEGWVAIGELDDTIDLVQVALGGRWNMGERRQHFFRTGIAYHDLDFNNGITADGIGVYVGYGYEIFLNKEETWSIAPEVILHLYNLEVPVGGGFTVISDDLLAGSIGLTLTYHFGRKKKAQDEYGRPQSDRDIERRWRNR